MKITTNRSLVILILLVFQFPLLAQKKVRIERAEAIESDVKDGKRFNKLTGNVIFSHKETQIYCDTAIVYKSENDVEAYGNVRIEQGDTITITGDKLIYSGESRVVRMRENVIFKTDDMTLYTDFLDYKRDEDLAYYFNEGKMVDTTNTITSVLGYYRTTSKVMTYKKDVLLVNEDFRLETDTLVYNTITQVAHFVAPTKVVDKNGNVITYDRGAYNTNIKLSDLFTGTIETDEYILKGDKLVLDEINKYYKAIGNVEMTVKEDDIKIYGEIGEHWDADGITKVYGEPLLKKYMDEDTLHLAADTLIALDSADESQKRLLAYHNVKIFKPDLQGKADSLAYFTNDSTIYFYRDPILWLNNDTQITADSIDILIADNNIDRMHANNKSFIILQDTLKNFNQVKGRKTTAFFKDSEINKVDVIGNGESIYFALNEEETNAIGMNKVRCSSMLIDFENNEVKGVRFYTNPDAVFIPPHEIKEPDRRLKDFNWRINEKPSLEEVLRLLPPSPLPAKEEVSLPADTTTNTADESPYLSVETEEKLANIRK